MTPDERIDRIRGDHWIAFDRATIVLNRLTYLMEMPQQSRMLGLMVYGYTTAGSAAKLNVSVDTIRQHKKSVYRKLEVSSQAELFSLFLSSLSCIEKFPNADPLAVFDVPGQSTNSGS